MASSRTSLAPHRDFRRRVLARDRGKVRRCPVCAVELDYDVTRQPSSAEPDHIVAIALGGSNATENGRTICRRCNQQRGSKPLTEPDAKPTARTPVTASPIW